MYVCASLWYVILEHEGKNVWEELIWRVLIATIKTPIHISKGRFTIHVIRRTCCNIAPNRVALGTIPSSKFNVTIVFCATNSELCPEIINFAHCFS